MSDKIDVYSDRKLSNSFVAIENRFLDYKLKLGEKFTRLLVIINELIVRCSFQRFR